MKPHGEDKTQPYGQDETYLSHPKSWMDCPHLKIVWGGNDKNREELRIHKNEMQSSQQIMGRRTWSGTKEILYS